MQIQLHSLCRAKTCICGLKIEPFTNIQLGTQIHIQQNIKVLKIFFIFQFSIHLDNSKTKVLGVPE